MKKKQSMYNSPIVIIITCCYYLYGRRQIDTFITLHQTLPSLSINLSNSIFFFTPKINPTKLKVTTPFKDKQLRNAYGFPLRSTLLLLSSSRGGSPTPSWRFQPTSCG